MNDNARWAGLLAAVLLCGCSTNLSSLQTARTLYPGQVRSHWGVGVYLPAGQMANAVSAGVDTAVQGVTAAAKQEQFILTEDTKQQLFTSGIALAVMPPSVQYETGVRVGLVNNLDVGFRYSVSSVRLDAKWRPFHFGDEDTREKPASRSIDLAIGFGVSKYIFTSPLVEALDYVKLGDFDRWDFEFPLYASVDFNPYFGIYLNPKYTYSVTTMDEELVLISNVANEMVNGQCCGEVIALDTRIPERVDMHFWGGTVGLKAGHPKVYGFLEVTVGYARADTYILGQKRNLGGVMLQPNLGVAFAW
jgi:hypothetical protein